MIFLRGRKPSSFVLILLVIVVALVFCNVPRGEFVMWDDDTNIYQNPYQGAPSWQRIIWMFTDTKYVVYYAPLSWLTLSIIYQFSGLNPFGYHLASLLLHIGNTIPVYYLIRICLTRFIAVTQNLRDPAVSVTSAVGALLWSIHPLRVEAVAWATGISYLLSSFFALLSLIFYLNAQAAADRVRYNIYFTASVFTFLLGILSYPAIMAFPALLVILDVLVLRRVSYDVERRSFGPPGVWLEKLPFFLISGGVFVFTLYRRSHSTDFWLPAASLKDFTVIQRAAQAFYVWAYYLWKSCLPVSLSPAYSTLASIKPMELHFILSFAGIMGTTVWLLLKWRRLSGLLALWLAYLCLLVPMLGLTEHPYSTSDRYSYFATITISIALSAVMVSVWKNMTGRFLSFFLCAALAAGCAVLSYRQTLIWQNTVALFQHMLKTFESEASRANIRWRLGIFYRENGKLDAAETEFRTALALTPDSATGHNDLGFVLRLKNKTDEAVKEFEIALQKDPNLWTALNNLAWIRATAPDPRLRRGDQAVALALRACETTGFANPRLMLTLAAAYAEAGEFDAAIRTSGQVAEIAEARSDHQLADLARRMAGEFQSRKPHREALPENQ